MRPTTDSANERMRRRLSSRLIAGIALGLLLGVVAGVIVGSIVSAPGRLGFWIALVGCAVFATFVGALLAGYSSLESPDPGEEPSDTRSPLIDRPELTREEHDADRRP